MLDPIPSSRDKSLMTPLEIRNTAELLVWAIALPFALPLIMRASRTLWQLGYRFISGALVVLFGALSSALIGMAFLGVFEQLRHEDVGFFMFAVCLGMIVAVVFFIGDFFLVALEEHDHDRGRASRWRRSRTPAN